MLTKEDVTRLGNQLGFEIVRISSADPFTDYEKTVRERIRARLYPEELITYEKILENFEIYADPSNSLPGAKSIISMAFSYKTDEPPDLTKPGEPHGVFARAYQRDVYGEMYRRCDKFVELLRKKSIQVAKKNNIPYKMAAVRAGIGWQGKNSLILTEEYGSWITLCSLVIDVEFEPDEPLSQNCGSCQVCQRACPTTAIKSHGIINVNSCIDYLTTKTGEIPRDLRSKMGNRLVSCDRCQEVCPYNKLVKPVKKEIARLNPEFRYSPILIPLLNITEEEYGNYFFDCDFIDSRSEYLQRNVIVALGNVGDPVAVPALIKFLKDGTPLLRRHAAWALGVINTTKAYSALKEAISKEQDLAIRKEILYALDNY